MEQIRLMIVDDHVMVREGLKHLLEMETHYSVTAEAGNGKKCLDLLLEVKPDVLLLDLTMPVMTGFDVLQKIRENQNHVKVLVLTFHEELDYFARAVDLGADGYILKSCGIEELKKAICCVSEGSSYFQPELADKLNRNRQQMKNDLDRMQRLTKRELEVLKHLSVGMYNKEIAMKLNISERTVKNHIFNIFKKIGASDRTQAAVFAIRNHLIDVDV